MKQRARAGTQNLFLLELVISVLFFSLASAVCVQLFADSHRKSREAKELKLAVNTVSSCAEVITAAEDPEQAKALLAQVFPGLSMAETDSGFRAEMPMDASADTLEIQVSLEEQMMTASLSVIGETGETVYGLTLSHHVQRGNPYAQ